MQLYNSLTRRKEVFEPVNPGRVSMYVCGITAYDLCHIGHARSAVVFDVLARYLRHSGLKLTFARNFTDVDDKIINKANQEGISSQAVAEKYIQAFYEDMDKLGVLRADLEPKATEHIPDMIGLCEKLIADGKAYSTPSGDVYFRVRAFAEYGKLSGRSIDELQSGARVAPGEEKEDPLDFALWKGAKPGEPSWPSPWGPGRPGWHIECSAMSEKHMTLPLDIHGGGQDLIFPHHENEIAQSEAALGKPLSKYWVHNGFVQVDAEKMSKSLGNFKTIRDILGNYLPEVLRFFLLTRHYRSPIDFTYDSMDDAEKNLKRIYESLLQLDAELEKSNWAAPLPEKTTAPLKEELTGLTNSLAESMADDLNTAAAIGHINSLARFAKRLLEDKALRKSASGQELMQGIKACFAEWGEVLGLFTRNPQEFLQELKEQGIRRKGIDLAQVEKLLQDRLDAKAAKDFAASDNIRQALAELGVEARDTPAGQVWDLML